MSPEYPCIDDGFVKKIHCGYTGRLGDFPEGWNKEEQ
jgi:hypothetical protein